mgnify:CR=1 FL=1
MKEKLENVLSSKITNQPQQVQLSLPKLKKPGGNGTPPLQPKLNLPKLSKVKT